MSIFDFLKKKKPIKKKAVRREEKPPEEEIKKEVLKKPRKRISEIATKVLYSPHVTEKATGFDKDNKYVFKVASRANKIEIKKAVEDFYGVDVIGTRIINVPRRKRRLGRQIGWKKGYKKAIVKIKKGQKIEILPR